MSKKIFAMFLAVLMVISLLPTTALAAPKCPGKGLSHTLNNCDATAGKVVAPVCSVPGFTYYTCNVCGVEFRDSYVKATGEHDFVADPATAVAPTCGKPGYEAGKSCSVCGEVEEGKKLPAVYEEGVACDYRPSVEIDCQIGGIQIDKCVNCGDEKAPYVVRAKEYHEWTIGPVVLKEATATEKAVAAFYCECGASQEATVFDTHECRDFTVWVEYPATCTENGVDGHYECRACGTWWVYGNTTKKQYIISEEEKPYYVIPADHQWGEMTDPDMIKKYPNVKAPDYNAYVGGFPCGTSQRYCVACDTVIAVTVKHSYDLSLLEYVLGGYGQEGPYDELTNSLYNFYEGQWEAIAGMEQTCESAGSYMSTCENCGSKAIREFPALGHELVTVTVPATCGTYGYTFTYCMADECHKYVDGELIENVETSFGYVGELNATVKYDVTVDTFVPHSGDTAPAVGTAFLMGFWQNALGEYRYFNGEMDGKYLATTNKVEEAVEIYVENFNDEPDKYLLYFMNLDGSKTYIELYNELNAEGDFEVKIRLSNYAPRVNYFEYDSFFKTFKARLWDKYSDIYFGTGEEVCIGEACDGCNDCSKANYYLGTYGNYSTISASSDFYFWDDMDFGHRYDDCVVYGFESSLDYEGTQYVATLGTIERLPVKLVDIKETSGFDANNHNFSIEVSNTETRYNVTAGEPASSCLYTGKIVYRCSEPGCSETLTITVPKKDHKWVNKGEDEATSTYSEVPGCYDRNGVRTCLTCGKEEAYTIRGFHILLKHNKFQQFESGDHVGKNDRYVVSCFACNNRPTLKSTVWEKGTAIFSAADYWELVELDLIEETEGINDLMRAAIAANYYHGNELSISEQDLANTAIWKEARRGDCSAVGLLSTTCGDETCKFATVYIVRNDDFGATGEHSRPDGLAQSAPVDLVLTDSADIYAVDIVAPLKSLFAGYVLNVTVELAEGQTLALYKVNAAGVLENLNLAASAWTVTGKVHSYTIAEDGIYAINVKGIDEDEEVELSYTLNLPGYVAPTCEDEGYSFGFVCQRCESNVGKNVNMAEMLPAIGHSMIPNMGQMPGYDEYEPGECGEPNTYDPIGYCENCDKLFWEASAADDRARPWGITEVWGENKCEDMSYSLYFCNACEELHIFSMYGEFGHDFRYVSTSSAKSTCYAPAYDIYECSACGEEKKVYDETVAHVNAAGEKFFEKCTDTVTDRHCVVCHEFYCAAKGEGHDCVNNIDPKTGDYLCLCMISADHNFDIDIDDIEADDWTAASCTMPKHIVAACKDCDFVYYEEEGEALGHQPERKVAEYPNYVYPDDAFIIGMYGYIPQMTEYVAPTRMSDGYGKFYCERCEAEVTQVYPRIEGIGIELNATNANGRDDLAVGSLIAVTVSINGFDQEVYGFEMDMPFFSEMLLAAPAADADLDAIEEAESIPALIYVGYEVLTDDFVLAVTKAGKDQIVEVVDDVNVIRNIRIAGYAANNILSGKRENFVVNEKTELVTLYFRAMMPFAYDEENDLPGYVFDATAEADKLDELGKVEEIDTNCEFAEIKSIAAFGDVDDDDNNDFHITDLYAAMGMLTGEYAGGKDYSAAVDFDKDGEFTLLDLANMYQAYVGSFDDMEILLAGVSAEEAEFLRDVLAHQILECQSRKCDEKFDKEYEYCPVCGWPQEWD